MIIDTVKSVKLDWVQVNGKNCLRFTFVGMFTKEDAESASDEWKKHFTQENGEKTVIIFNCLNMEDYEPLARVTWQNTIKSLKSEIKGIWVVTDSKLIASGAAIMGVFTSFAIKAVASESLINLD
jgi:hypothetical protein